MKPTKSTGEKKIILDLCGGTGAWSAPYKEAGYDVRNITLPEYDVRNWIVNNYGDLIFQGNAGAVNQRVKLSEIYGILAAPPCTEFSLAKSTKPRNFTVGMEIVKACLNLIWESRLKYKLKFWAMENPRGFLRQFIGKPVFTFEQWEFGHKGVKPTDIWGYFNEPRKKIKIKPEGLSRFYPCGKRNALGWSKSAEERAITPRGFALAFYSANK